jgi:hypothetical protein
LGGLPRPSFPFPPHQSHAPQPRPWGGHRRGAHCHITALLDRHAAGDWGELSDDDKAANDEAARSDDGRLFSSYSTAEHSQLWIITDNIRGEGEGPITTVMFPEDY